MLENRKTSNKSKKTNNKKTIGGIHMIKKFKKQMNNEKGLTLIELLAVIVILGIVAAIAVPAIGSVISNSRDKAILADASNILAGAKLAAIDGACDPEDSKKPCDKGVLENSFVEGLDNDLTYSVTKTGSAWSVTYSKFDKIKNDKYNAGIDDKTVTETDLNNLLK